MQGFARATSYIPSEVSFTTTGNIDNLDFSGADLIRMNNASDATIRGLVAGTPGQKVTIVSIGAGVVYLAHQNTGSSAANRLIHPVTSGNTPLAAGSGRATYQYDGTTDRWRLLTHVQGAAINVAFNAANFTANVGSWTVDAADQVTLAYTLEGSILSVTFFIEKTDISSTPHTLSIALPNGYLPSATFEASFNVGVIDAGAAVAVGRTVVRSSGSFLEVNKINVANFTTTAADNTDVFGQMRFNIS